MGKFKTYSTFAIAYSVLVIAVVFLSQGCSNSKIKQQQRTNSYYELLVDTILHHSNRQFKKVDMGGMSFYYEEDPFFNSNIYKLASEALKAKSTCLKLLQEEKIIYKLKVIYFNDREKLRPYLHMAPKGIALPDAYTLLIVTNDTIRAYHTHELMHIISIDRFGGYAAEPSDWIQEGMSVYADNPCMGYSIHAIGAYLYHTKKMPSLDSLFTRFRVLPDMIGYIYTGSFTGFIIDKYGMQKFEQLWKKGVGNLHSVIGKTKDELEKEYHNFLMQKYPRQPDIDWELLKNKGCG